MRTLSILVEGVWNGLAATVLISRSGASATYPDLEAALTTAVRVGDPIIDSAPPSVPRTPDPGSTLDWVLALEMLPGWSTGLTVPGPPAAVLPDGPDAVY